MSAKKGEPVARPSKKADYQITLDTREAVKGWTDLLATQRSSVVDAWDFLTADPTRRTAKNDQLRGDLALVTANGKTHQRWQHELSGGARIWYYIEGKEVHIRIAALTTPTRPSSHTTHPAILGE